ncbi:hypothetical protein F4805DRAFT_127552 [Annulohypoxylon moriforme]|nr:hypothetical protein F4805DRAFT_127552 [Annulohypoxylon moriforme]
MKYFVDLWGPRHYFILFFIFIFVILMILPASLHRKIHMRRTRWSTSGIAARPSTFRLIFYLWLRLSPRGARGSIRSWTWCATHDLYRAFTSAPPFTLFHLGKSAWLKMTCRDTRVFMNSKNPERTEAQGAGSFFCTLSHIGSHRGTERSVLPAERLGRFLLSIRLHLAPMIPLRNLCSSLDPQYSGNSGQHQVDVVCIIIVSKLRDALPLLIRPGL